MTRPLMKLAPLGMVLTLVLLVLALTPLVTANGYFGGMLTFPLEEQPKPPADKPLQEGR